MSYLIYFICTVVFQSFIFSAHKEVALFLFLCTFILAGFSFLISKKIHHKQHNKSELLARVSTFWSMLIFFDLCLLVPASLVSIGLCLIGLTIFLELLSFKYLQPAFFWHVVKSSEALFFTPFLLLFYFLEIFGFEIQTRHFILCFVCGVSPVFWLFKNGTLLAEELNNYLWCTLSFLIAGPFYIYLVKLARIDLVLFLILVFVVQVRDLSSYWIGKWVVKSSDLIKSWNVPFASNISPNKTGLVGLLAAVVTVFIFKVLVLSLDRVFMVSGVQFIGLSFSVGLGGFLGDLIFSFFKRGFAIKDSSQWMPGQSGLVDRIDALVFTLPFCYLVMIYL